MSEKEQTSSNTRSDGSWLRAFVILAIALWAFSAGLPRLAAMFWEAEDATVWLDGCTDESCALHGTLSHDPLTMDYELTREDGSVMVIPEGSTRMMSWPAPKG